MTLLVEYTCKNGIFYRRFKGKNASDLLERARGINLYTQSESVKFDFDFKENYDGNQQSKC